MSSAELLILAELSGFLRSTASMGSVLLSAVLPFDRSALSKLP
jgi:hypothetical protein